MTYNEAKEYLEECGRESGIRPGLMRMRRLLTELGNPQESLRVVHLAGTNGKGSTAAFLASIFSEAGYKTGRFASPAVFGTREIFLITEDKGRGGQELSEEVEAVGQPGTRTISREEYSSLVSGLKEVASRMEQEPCGAPTRFELETAMAFLYFQKERCDIVLLETGLGGTEDATNVLTRPLASVLTSISYDHRRFLGETIAEIAGQKAGIIKEGCPVFSYDQEVMGDISREVINREAGKKHAPLVFADYSKLQAVEEAFFSGEDMEKADEAPVFRNCFIYKEKEYETALLGEHQCRNAALAIEVAEGLSSLRISKGNIYNGIKKTRWPGRLEPVAGHPLVLLDGAHNPDAARGLAAALKRYFPGKRMVYLMGLFADKDYGKIIAYTLPMAEKVFCVTTHTKRALKAEKLCEEVLRQGGCAVACESIREAVERAVVKAGPDGVVVAFGSLSFLGDVRDYMEQKEGVWQQE